MRQANDDVEILDWFFGTEPVGKLLNWPIGARKLASSIKQIHLESKREPADADAIRQGWDSLSAAVGPMLICHFLGSEEWRDIVPAVSGSGKGWMNVWADDTLRVVARLVYSDGEPINVEFSVLPKE